MGKNIFNSIKMTKPKTNIFDLTHDVKTSFNLGQLIPVCCVEGIPGDHFNISTQSLVRFAPLIAPVMHRLDITIHYFFVPYRLLWQQWQNYITGTVDPNTGVQPIFPYINVGPVSAGGVVQVVSGNTLDYLGVPFTPVGSGGTENISAMPIGAYMKIYNDYYRDQNLIPDFFPQNTSGGGYALQSGSNSSKVGMGGWNTPQKRAWEHDYFTASLPFAQKGNAVSIPLGNVMLKANTPGTNPTTYWRRTSDYTIVPAIGTANITTAGVGTSTDSGSQTTTYDPQGSLTVAPTLINDLRRAYALQRWLEVNARGGTRYIESILAHFGVASSDKRLQRPEYICGMKAPIIISEIVNTGGDQATLPQGNMAGHGLGAAAGKAGSYFCEEHGLIMGIASILPKTAYQQGLPKMYTKINDQYDWFWPELAHLGEQAVLNNEIYAYQTSPTNLATFGYVPRYAEYKFEFNRVCGDFRGNLDYWHFGRVFTSAPQLNQTFIECTPRTDVFAVTDPATQHMYAHVLNSIKVRRLMPKYGTPAP